jgi:hypothetical protein
MTDEIKGKKISDFAYWIKIKGDPGDATILAFKRSESEKKGFGAGASLAETKVAGQYSKETEGNTWDTIIMTKEHGLLPLDTWKTKAGMERVRQAVVQTSGATTFVALSEPFVASVPTDSFYRCKNCGELIVFASADGLCPSCGKKFTV